MKTKITVLVVFFIVFFNGFAQVQLDSAFGTGGRVTTMFPQNLIYGVDSAILADGKIVVCGQFYAGVIIGLFENYQNH